MHANLYKNSDSSAFLDLGTLSSGLRRMLVAQRTFDQRRLHVVLLDTIFVQPTDGGVGRANGGA